MQSSRRIFFGRVDDGDEDALSGRFDLTYGHLVSRMQSLVLEKKGLQESITPELQESVDFLVLSNKH